VNTTSKHIIEQCIAGDRDAQYRLYQMYADKMLNVAYRIVNNREDARDILQDAFIKAFKSLKGFKFNASFETWFKRIVINTALNFVQKKGINIVSDLDKVSTWYADSDTSCEDYVDSNYSIQIAKKALMELPMGYRTVLSLYLIEGYDHAEISEILNISKSTSLTQYKRGKEKLQAIIKKRIQNAEY